MSNQMPDKKLGYQNASLWGLITYSFVSPLLRLGARSAITEDTARQYFPDADHAQPLSEAFEAAYAKHSKTSHGARAVWRTYWTLYRWRSLEHLIWCFIEIGVRVGNPLLLRQLLQWFSLSDSNSPAAPTWKGWMWAGLLAGFSYTYVLVHHQLFWRGMRMGMQMRLQAIAAVEAKVLRLNAASVADVTGGRIVNVVSNDVRRFDEAGTFWVFLITGPVELLVVLLLVGFRLGFAASVSGVSTLLLLIPAQAWLAKYIGHLRASTAAQTDERVRLQAEVIAGVLACKMMAWEDPLLERLTEIRTRESKYIRRMNCIRAVNMGLNYSITPIVSLITFATARATGAELTVANLFYSLALLSLPKLYVCEFFVHAVECVSELRVSVQRIGEFLDTPEPAPMNMSESRDDKDVAIAIKHANFDWTSDKKVDDSKPSVGDGVNGATNHDGTETPITESSVDLNHYLHPHTLEDIDVTIKRGELVAIVGAVGAGKSSLLAALLGELQPLDGDVNKVIVHSNGTIGYCQQIPWIMSGTVRDNILFGLPFDEPKYKAVVAACALQPDIRSMPAGDSTEIGERGISISGGQKARLSLARAAYSSSSVYLMDDPLSAVDPRVGRVLFQRCIGPQGLMQGAARVLVTHQRQYLPWCDRIIVLRHGRIIADGTYAALQRQGVAEVVGTVMSSSGHMSAAGSEVDLSALDEDDEGCDETFAGSTGLDQNTVKETGDTPERKTPSIVRFDIASSSMKSTQSLSMRRAAFGKSRLTSGYLRRFISGRLQPPPSGASALVGDDDGGKTNYISNNTGKSGRLIVKEDQAEGSVTWRVYGALLKRLGLLNVTLITLGLLGGQACYLYGEYWLASWAAADPVEQQEAKWIWVYAIFASCVFVLAMSRSVLFFLSALRASTDLHNTATARLVRAPLSFFHTNPTGRILNRFSKDQGAIDEQLPMVAFDAVSAFMMVIGAFTLLVIVVPFILPVFVPLGVAFFWVQRRYLKTSRELKRFEAVTRSPLYASFSASLKGLPTIRAFNAAERFKNQFLELLSENGSWWFSWLTCARWIGFRLDCMVAVLLTCAPLLMMAVHDRLSPRLVGLALTQSLYLAGMLQWMVRQSAEVENAMTSAERLLSYCALQQEPPTVAQGAPKPPSKWPQQGTVSYVNVSAVYRPGLPAVLRNLTFEIPGGVSCGVVGRTGSGKSSLMLTLFRLIPITSGKISIDGIESSSIGLDALRRQIAIIPQDPVLFSGTLRSNLDPWSQFGDAALWDALDTAQLKGAAAALGGLDARMQECGDNLSAGQRQLLCLARALLQDAAVLALDEATANVDRETDSVIQMAVRRACRDGKKKRTLLVIAHRIDTIMDCDKLLVLSGGELVEQGSPQELMATKGGVFAGMVAAATVASNGSMG